MTDSNFQPEIYLDIPKTVQQIFLGDTALTIYLMCDDNYRISWQEAADCILENRQTMTAFLKSAVLQKFRSEISGYDALESIWLSSESSDSNTKCIKVIPLDVPILYWLHMWRKMDNQNACNLLSALAVDSLERRFDCIFSDHFFWEATNNDTHTQITRERITNHKVPFDFSRSKLTMKPVDLDI